MTSDSRVHSGPTLAIDPQTLYRILQLRVEVFVVEQACPYPELDGRDLEPTATQFWISDDAGAAGEPGAVLATLRLLAEPPAPDGRGLFRIGRVCTERGHRGRGLVSQLMGAALARVGDADCRIEAQTYLTDMYAKFGFVVDGEEYLDDGIPHVSMVRAGGR